MESSCLILDGFALTYRAFYGVPTTIRNADGNTINAALGFYNSLQSLIDQFQPHYLIAVFDHHEPTFRHKLFPEYKAQRPPMPAELRQQLPMIKAIVEACKIPLLRIPGYEADDVIGTITRNLPKSTHAYVVTVDRDCLQLVNQQVTVVIPNSQNNQIYTPDIVEHEAQVTPTLIPDLKALMGDPSDNIPGIKLVGPKTAVKWLQLYGSLEAIIEAADQLPGKAGENLRKDTETALLYKDLTTIRLNVPITWCWKSCQLASSFGSLNPILDAIGIRAKLPQNLRAVK